MRERMEGGREGLSGRSVRVAHLGLDVVDHLLLQRHLLLQPAHPQIVAGVARCPEYVHVGDGRPRKGEREGVRRAEPRERTHGGEGRWPRRESLIGS